MKIVGIDEVGRGSWAGPLVIGAVILNKPIVGLKDSKLLTKTERLILYKKIIKANYYSTGWVWSWEIDKYGLSKSLFIGANRALKQFNIPYDQILIDGNYNFVKRANCQTIIRGDIKIPEISAASIVAKVQRDNYMTLIDKIFYGYKFSSNVGYGTKYHQSALRSLGACQIHRYSFKPIKNLKLLYAN